jgi:hypothetical protein
MERGECVRDERKSATLVGLQGDLGSVEDRQAWNRERDEAIGPMASDGGG